MTTPISAWPDPSTKEGEAFFASAQRIFGRWKFHGVSNPFAFAMLTMAEAESSLIPTAAGDHLHGVPTAFGLYQWHAGRIAMIAKPKPFGAGIDISKFPPVEDQVDAAWWELSTFPFYGKAQIEGATTAAAAAWQATVTFERAGALDAAVRRSKMAERWVTHWASLNP